MSPSACNKEFKATTKINNIEPENINECMLVDIDEKVEKGQVIA